jgi:hypothetical protein
MTLRLNFTVRRMMLAVAVVATLLACRAWMIRRAARFRDLSAYHTMEWERIDTTGSPDVDARGEWHRAMGVKYRDASRRPWLPVEPDTPEPE